MSVAGPPLVVALGGNAILRKGERGREPEAYGAALGTSPEARERIRAFIERKRK